MIPLGLLGLCLLLYSNTLFHPFVHDDIVFILQNPDITHWDLAKIFYSHATPQGAGINTYYRPLLEIIYRLEYIFFGFAPWGWHLFNALLHGINAALVWQLLVRLDVSRPAALMTAALFAAHPVQTEAVACVAGISNLTMAFFVLAALVCYLKERLGISIVLFVLGLFAKEQALMAAPLVVLVDWYRGRVQWRRWFGFAFAAAGFLILRQALSHASVLAEIFASLGELKLRLAAIAQVLAMDARILLFPDDLHYYRSTDILTANLWWWPAVAGAAVVICKCSKPVRFGALWFILTLLPVLNIVPLVNEYSLILTAEHFLYLPMIGFMLIGCVLLHKMLLGRPKAFNAVCAALVIACGTLTIHQNKYWRSETALFERTVKFEPNFARAHLLLAKAYYFQKEYSYANYHFRRAYDIMHSYLLKAKGRDAQRFYAGFMEEIVFDWQNSLRASKF